MCFKVDCKQCGKFTWGGCGAHVALVYNKIEKGKHCTRQAWTGVVMTSETTSGTTLGGDEERNLSFFVLGSVVILVVYFSYWTL